MARNNVQDAMWQYIVKYLLSEEAAVNGIAETTLREMSREGHRFKLAGGETLDEKCLSVSLLREPQADVKLESVFNGVRVFYHICNGREERRIYVPA